MQKPLSAGTRQSFFFFYTPHHMHFHALQHILIPFMDDVFSAIAFNLFASVITSPYSSFCNKWRSQPLLDSGCLSHEANHTKT